MNILVTNDDGIYAKGIYELVRALSERATIYVCAPDTQRSASGHGITVSEPIIVEETGFEYTKAAFRITGTPADCVKLGMQLVQDKGAKIDMVYAGINHGGNLGTDTLYSGTVSAAIEGTICGVPSVAVSVNSHTAKHFDFACKLACRVLDGCMDNISPDTAININTPDMPESQIKGVKCVGLGKREYTGEFGVHKVLVDGKLQYEYGGEPIIYEGLQSTTDVIAMQEGYATITPLQRDFTDYKLLGAMKEWRI